MATAAAFAVEYGFDEIEVCGAGLLAYGTATLVLDDDRSFYVDEIVLDGGKRFDRRGTGALGSEFSKRLFEVIAAQIEASEHAQEYFASELDDASRPCPDRAYEERRDSFLHAAE